jgi:LPS sulfotransferase NodH
MRHVATLLLGFLILTPDLAAAKDGQGSSECRHLTAQVSFFEARLQRAQALDNPIWEERLGRHLNHLIERRATRCPEYSDGAQAMKQLQELLTLAAKGAASFFTMGAY